jgi:1-acyl-sn-glycerol-3-phosphate acyltransferase
VPRSGGVILVANHRAMMDPIVIGCSVPFRRIYFMAKEELFHFRPFAILIRALGAFPVKRDKVDRKALKTAEKILNEGKILLIFGEGTRNRDFSKPLGELQAGFVYLSSKVNVPVVPVYTFNTYEIFYKIFRWPKVIVKFGKPICYKENLFEEIKGKLLELSKG